MLEVFAVKEKVKLKDCTFWCRGRRDNAPRCYINTMAHIFYRNVYSLVVAHYRSKQTLPQKRQIYFSRQLYFAIRVFRNAFCAEMLVTK